MKMKYKIAEIVKENGKEYIEDYRIKNGKLEFIKGKLGDLKLVYVKSTGLGDLLSCFASLDMEKDEFVIIQYGDKFALGTK